VKGRLGVNNYLENRYWIRNKIVEGPGAVDKAAGPTCSGATSQRGMNLKTLWMLIKDTFCSME
jgi:hypothetical protein